MVFPKLIPMTADTAHHVRQWLNWVEKGGKHLYPYNRNEGLCHAAYRTFLKDPDGYTTRASAVFRNICEIMEQRVGDSCVFHSWDSQYHEIRRLDKSRASSTLPDCALNPYRVKFFKLLLKQHGD